MAWNERLTFCEGVALAVQLGNLLLFLVRFQISLVKVARLFYSARCQSVLKFIVALVKFTSDAGRTSYVGAARVQAVSLPLEAHSVENVRDSLGIKSVSEQMHTLFTTRQKLILISLIFYLMVTGVFRLRDIV